RVWRDGVYSYKKLLELLIIGDQAFLVVEWEGYEDPTVEPLGHFSSHHRALRRLVRFTYARYPQRFTRAVIATFRRHGIDVL
ncbi:hypothetical protein PENTCL1PPCAC_10922, partial [Pristionchus entomophagus]